MITRYENTVIRKPVQTDLMLLFLCENNPNFQFNKEKHKVRYYLETIKEHLATINEVEKNQQMRLMVENERQHTIGVVDLFEIDLLKANAKMGVLIAEKSSRGKGHAFKALGLMMDYAFKKWQIQYFIAEVENDNLASFHLFQKLKIYWQGVLTNESVLIEEKTDKFIFHFHLEELHRNFIIFE